MLTKVLVISDTSNAPLVIPEGVVKLLWYISTPLPTLPASLKILIAPHICAVGKVPEGLVYLEVTGNTLINYSEIPVTCHVEVMDYNCSESIKTSSDLPYPNDRKESICVKNSSVPPRFGGKKYIGDLIKRLIR